MTSMSLAFILCETEDKPAPPTNQTEAVGHESNSSIETSNKRTVARHRSKGGTSSIQLNKPLTPSERQKRVRHLQNIRQRRYRERKKSTASALQTNADNLHQKNEALETAILKHFN
ncbi:hypothetical protein DVH05_001837 [Phytophthora capsici]|nr:hypothetical protein DVH05_001837 [Phytophthora capsici]